MVRARGPERKLARRAFLRRAAVTGAGTLLLPLAARGGGEAAGASAAPPILDRTTFGGCLGQRFQVQVRGRSIDVVLVRVADWARRPAGTHARSGECFSVVFRDPRGATFPQGTYIFRHGRLGTFPLFVVPGAATRLGQSYEALFNRLP